ncbi:histidine kinase [Terriglobus sp.]|uniref:histidine kinase n=1 Tax=Terriglobus sp. TaxID=1889013 RepID=UPI003B00C6AD
MWLRRHSSKQRRYSGCLGSWPVPRYGFLAVLLACVASIGAQQQRPFAVVSIASLRTEPLPASTRVTVQGVITRTGSTLYMQDRSGGLEVETSSTGSTFQIGDEVRITGTPTENRYSSLLRADDIRLMHARIPDPPVAITPGMGASGAYDRLLIDTEGVLQATVELDGRTALLLFANHQFFLAQPPEQDIDTALAALKPGSRLRIRGVCVMGQEASPYPVAFRVLLRSSQDVTLLAGPPFWTSAHMLWAIAVLLLLTYASLRLMRRFERWRFGLILDERTRLAHDLHDTLAQNFAGIAFQLQAIRSALRKKKSGEKIDGHVELAIGMVAHSHEDARRSIAMLRPAQPMEGGLLLQLREQADLLTRGGEIRLEVLTSEEPAHIEPVVRNALLRIGHEAITNTVRHASASLVTIALDETPQHLHLRITDDGSGFERRSGHARGFGIDGMEARAASCGGLVTITSAAGRGCTVEAVLPHHDPRKQVRHWLMLLLKGRPNASQHSPWL